MTQYTQIPKDAPVKLIRTFCTKTGNIYFPGVYAPGVLPDKAYNSFYMTTTGPAVVSTAKQQAFTDSTISNGKFEVQGVDRHTGGPGLKEEVEINKSPTTKTLKPKISKAEEVPAININTASEEELIALPTVGKVTAKKVIELREASPFIDYTDLNSRAPLPFSRDWTGFDLKF